MNERERLETLPPEPNRGEPRPPEAAPAQDVLALQRSAGNRAVSGLLARQPAPGTADAPTAADDSERGSTMTLGLGDDIVIPLESASFGGGGRADDAKDLHVTFVMNNATPKLMQMAAEGRAIPSAFLSSAVMTSTMTDVALTNVNMGGGSGKTPLVSLSMNFTAVEHKPASP